VTHEASFKTLTEARKFKAKIKGQRKKREERMGLPSISAERTMEREHLRAQIKEARKNASTVVRDGKQFRVIRLEDDPSIERKRMRDLRDPEKLGTRYLMLRDKGVDIDVAVDMPVPAYQNGKYISADPAFHHSKVDQTQGNLDDGGAS
jgi:Trk K+ transport system NAD-binding subunit